MQNGYVNVGDKRRKTRVTGLPIVPKQHAGTVETYAFLDGGSNTSFITGSLLKKLAVKGSQTTPSLTTMEKERIKLESSVVSIEVCDLNGQNVVEIPTVFSVPKLPVSSEDISRRSDVDRRPHLQGIVLGEIEYAMRTVWGWTVNGPLGQNGHQDATTNFIQSNELEKSFRRFCNREFNDVEDDVAVSCHDKRALKVMEESV